MPGLTYGEWNEFKTMFLLIPYGMIALLLIGTVVGFGPTKKDCRAVRRFFR